MEIIIYKAKEFMPNTPYKNWPLRIMRANEIQEQKINELRQENSGLQIVPHARKDCNDALISLDKYNAVWISPQGHLRKATPIYPFCYGNPSIAHCIVYGFCRRNPACND